jgi:hypothetical protein
MSSTTVAPPPTPPPIYVPSTRATLVDRGSSVVVVFIAEGGLDARPPVGTEIILPPSGLAILVDQAQELLTQCRDQLEGNRPRNISRGKLEKWERTAPYPWGAHVCFASRALDMAHLHFYLVGAAPTPNPGGTLTPVISVGIDIWALEELLQEAKELLPSKNTAALMKGSA